MSGPPPPGPAPSRTQALDDAIARFWTDFVLRQTAAGRRDVARMLEVALEFFFERSTQISEADGRRRRHLESFLTVVRAERAKVQQAQAEALAGAEEAPLAVPYGGTEIVLRDVPGLEDPVVVRPLPQPLVRATQVRQYVAVLDQQVRAAEALLQSILDRIVSTRTLVAGRLKDLSPQLYQHGMDVIDRLNAEAEVAAVAAAAPPPQPVAAPPPAPRPSLGVQLTALLRLRLQALIVAVLGRFAALPLSLRRLQALRFRRLGSQVNDLRERQFEQTLEAYQRKADAWDRQD